MVKTVFEDFYIDISNPSNKKSLINQLSGGGVVTFDWNDKIEDLANFVANFGQVLKQDDTDEDGIKFVEEEYAIKGSFPHTDRSSMDLPPNFALIYCKKQSNDGGETVFVDGKEIYNDLKQNHPDALEALFKDNSVKFGIGKYYSPTAIFNKSSDGNTYLKFRYDEHRDFSSDVEKHIPVLLELVNKHKITFRLEDNQGYIVQNGRWLHGAEPSNGGRRLIYRILAQSEQISFGF